MLKVKNLDVFYGRIHALRRVSLHVRKGEITALIGGNGAGKTTLLTTVSGLLRAKAGELRFADREITNTSAEKIVSMGLVHVPEGRHVFKPLSVEDNLLLGAFSRGPFGGKGAIKKDREAVYEMFPVLGERRKQAAGTLSGGEQQMLAIGRALLAKPKLLLLDEPSMGLAPQITKDIFKHIVMLRDEFNLTVLLVEQNARMALKIADRGYVLETGRVMLQGPAGELLQNKDVQRAYLGREAEQGTSA
jgi:branched-chain amino acid transport system ATP-binding protein